MTSALAQKREGAHTSMRKRLRRKSSDARVEIETKSGWVSAQARDFNPRGLSVICGSKIEVGEEIRVLLYIPNGRDFDLMRVEAEVIWSKEQQGVFTLGATFRAYAPGDERRFRTWIIDQLKR